MTKAIVGDYIEWKDTDGELCGGYVKEIDDSKKSQPSAVVQQPSAVVHKFVTVPFKAIVNIDEETHCKAKDQASYKANLAKLIQTNAAKLAVVAEELSLRDTVLLNGILENLVNTIGSSLYKDTPN